MSLFVGPATVIVVLAMVASGASLSQVSNGAEPIPVDLEPRHHIAFADTRLRVLQVNVPAGDTTLEHRHDHDLVTVNIENGPTRTRDRGAEWSGVRPRDIGGVNVTEYTGKPTAHTVQAVGDRAYRLTGVENLRASGWTTLAPISGPYVTTVAESRAFRAYELRLPPAARITHTHAVPVVVTLVDGAANVAPGAGSALTTAGQWAVIAAAAAHTVDAGPAGARVVEIEVR